MKEKTTHINTGVRKILESPFVFNAFNSIIGVKSYMRKFCNKHYNSDKEMKMLDIGCGTCDILNYLNSNIDYYGFDFEESYINQAKQKFGSRGSFYHERVGQDLREDWLGSFDLINAHGLLHHLSDKDSDMLFTTAFKYLKKGGKFVTADTTYHDSQGAFTRWLVSKDRGQNIRKPNQYLKIASNQFKIVDSYVMDDYLNIPYSIFTMVLTK